MSVKRTSYDQFSSSAVCTLLLLQPCGQRGNKLLAVHQKTYKYISGVHYVLLINLESPVQTA